MSEKKTVEDDESVGILDNADIQDVVDPVTEHNRKFAINYQRALVSWNAKNPGKRPPVYKDSSGRFRWVNRAARMEEQKKRMRIKKRIAKQQRASEE